MALQINLEFCIIFVFLTVLKNWTSVYEICFRTLKAFPFTGYYVVVHLSSVRFAVDHDGVKSLFQPTQFCDCDFEKNAGFSAIIRS